MNKVSWIVIILLCVVGLGVLVYMNKGDSVDVSNVDIQKIVESSEETIGDHVYGKKDARVVLYEYADFQCGGCAAANRTIPAVKELYKDKVAFVFRNYPLVSIHPNAIAAASSVEAAGLQDKYWEMHSLVFSNQSQWMSLSAEKRGEAFDSYASQLNLNIEKFREDMASSKVQDKIRYDLAVGGKAGVTGTPTFFIGDKETDKAVVDDVLSSGGGAKLMDALDEALKDAGETPPERTK